MNQSNLEIRMAPHHHRKQLQLTSENRAQIPMIPAKHCEAVSLQGFVGTAERLLTLMFGHITSEECVLRLPLSNRQALENRSAVSSLYQLVTLRVPQGYTQHMLLLRTISKEEIRQMPESKYIKGAAAVSKLLCTP